MLNRKKKITLIVLCAILASVVTVTVFYTYGAEFHKADIVYDASIFDPLKTMSAEEVKKDNKELVTIVERAHPYFGMNKIPEGYEAAKAELLSHDREMGMAEYSFIVSKYLAIFRDVHLNALIVRNRFLASDANGYQTALKSDGVRVWSVDRTIAPGGELLSINGVETETLLNEIVKHNSNENRFSNLATIGNRITNADFLNYLGIGGDRFTMKFKMPDGSEAEFGYYARTTEDFLAEHPEEDDATPVKEDNAEVYERDGVTVIRLKRCYEDDSVAEAYRTVRDRVAAGQKKFVLDLVDNGGGNSSVPMKFYSAMGLKFNGSAATWYRKFSPETKKYRGTLLTRGGKYVARPTAERSVDNPNGITLVATSSAGTYSAATDPLTMLRAFGFGTIVGVTSGQNPSFNGNIGVVQLNCSKIVVQLPFTSTEYVDQDGNVLPAELTPDVETDLNATHEEIAALAVMTANGKA